MASFTSGCGITEARGDLTLHCTWALTEAPGCALLVRCWLPLDFAAPSAPRLS